MARINLASFSDDHFTIRFDTNYDIDVYTLSQALSGFADALREINKIVNPDFELEVVLESTGRGSFLAHIKTAKFAKTALQFTAVSIALPLLLSFVYDAWKGHEKPHWKVVGTELVLVTESDEVTMPASLEEVKQKIEANQKVAQGVRKAITAVDQDQEVKGMAVMSSSSIDNQTVIEIPRDDFPKILSGLRTDVFTSELILAPTEAPRDFRDTTQRVHLLVVKAVLKRSSRKWEFDLNGQDVSAPIIDGTFFDRLQLRTISLSQGDSLDADLKVMQKFDRENNVWHTTGYEIVHVYDVIPGQPPTTLEQLWEPVEPG
ncbi:hypothetical protein [Hyphomicrobium sp. 2TAF46]|uniref:hypothetical protein n=1 Tax=Hyphomicrobium sp. 2TAF46 TaxID=3233019 RepID=UPI003F8E1FC2